MDSKQFAKLRTILLEASDLPEEERDSYLAQACGDDDELRHEAKAILAAGTDPSVDLQQAADLSETTFAPRTDTPPLPDRIAGYRIIRIIGQGGMGIVYEAEQEKPKRTVALKVMKTGIASKSALRRFEYESQLLARLTHPGIGQVYEAGTYDDGSTMVPYFAMEFVPDARSIIDYAEEKKLGTRERLQLFTQVCDAVHHGHQKGVIHRDLKPGNILVTPEGQVKIIDFGVARSTDSDMALTTMKTDVGQMIGTLQYMSPEQCAADPNDIDTRSDVYALGVVQYELLCGQLPYDVKQKAIHEVARVIREEQPTRPSSISRKIRDDVETITLKALEKERNRRYQSAVELGQDIQRYLSGEAIIGRPPSMIYQMQIFARRHKVVFAALAAIFIVLAVGLAVSTSMYFRAEQARYRAEQARQKISEKRDRALAAEEEADERRSEAEAVTEFLSESLAAVDPSVAWGSEVTVREMLDMASEEIGESFPGQPLVEATLRMIFGKTYRALGEYSTAELHLETALDLREQELRENEPVCLFPNINTQGEAKDNRGESMSIMHGWFEGDELVTVDRLLTRRLDKWCSMSELGVLYYEQGRYDEAEPLLKRVLEFQYNFLGEAHPDTQISSDNLAILFEKQGYCRMAELLKASTRAYMLLHGGYWSFGRDFRSQPNDWMMKERYSEAEVILLKSYETLGNVQRYKHDKTMVTIKLLVALYDAWGKPDEADRWRARLLAQESEPGSGLSQ